MNRIKDDFKAGQPISSVGVGWFNAVAKFINNLVGGYGITINKDGDVPSIDFKPETEFGFAVAVPNEVKQSTGGLGDDAATVAARHPKDVLAIPDDETAAEKQEREIEDIGTSDFAARADHQHRLSTDIGDDPTDNTAANEEGSYPESMTLTFTDWEAGGTDGVKLRLYALVDASSSSSKVFFPIDIEIAANGLVRSVSSPSGDHGVWIGA